MWTRALLEDDYGVKPSDIRWVRGGLEEPGGREGRDQRCRRGCAIEDIGPSADAQRDARRRARSTRSSAPRAPTSFVPSNTTLGWLFEDPTREAMEYFRRTRIFPIMHLVGMRRSLAEQHPWLPMALFKAFERSKRVALAASRRHVGDQGDAAVRRGAAAARA